MHIRLLSALILLVAIAGWSQASPAVHAGTQKTAESRMSDSQIEGVIRAKLAKSKLVADGFTVHVKNRVATWEGKTNVIQHKGAATRMAKTAGATSVVNNIKISDEARRKAAERLAKYRAGNAPVKRATLVTDSSN
jgi:hypothetical protein